ncbi:terpene cyclase [Salix suchowensis]|nr:terpene cyclase [Salix suchowensis]
MTFPDEILQLVFYELNDPTPLTLVSKRFHNFSQDNFIRAHYFLARYGETQALFYALGRGRMLNERVLDVSSLETLLASGAHMSRSPFTTTFAPRVTSSRPLGSAVSPACFRLLYATRYKKYGEIPVGKNEDDGSIFATFLRESRFHPSVRTTNWEAIKGILEKYKFLPFTNKVSLASGLRIGSLAHSPCFLGPNHGTVPLALAIEPRLLPLAVANGFQMDSKYRDFVFRKMFERPIASSDTRADDIVRNARELCRLDPTYVIFSSINGFPLIPVLRMFLSRTVAAEVCMEAKTNEAAYLALQRLDKAGELRFDLSTLVEELIKLFATTRSIALTSVALTLRQLYADFPSKDYIARHVLLCSIFIQEAFNCSHAPVTHIPPIPSSLDD